MAMAGGISEHMLTSFVKCRGSIYFFLNSANLICRGTDISKYFKESFGLRDNVSQLYCVINEPILCLTTTFLKHPSKVHYMQ